MLPILTKNLYVALAKCYARNFLHIIYARSSLPIWCCKLTEVSWTHILLMVISIDKGHIWQPRRTMQSWLCTYKCLCVWQFLLISIGPFRVYNVHTKAMFRPNTGLLHTTKSLKKESMKSKCCFRVHIVYNYVYWFKWPTTDTSKHHERRLKKVVQSILIISFNSNTSNIAIK